MTTFSDFQFLTPWTPPDPPTRRWWWWGRPRGTMAQTSSTEAVAISPLKHLNEIPLGTTRTLAGLRVAWHALRQAAPQGLHLGHARHGHDGTPSLASQRLVLRDQDRLLREILTKLYII